LRAANEVKKLIAAAAAKKMGCAVEDLVFRNDQVGKTNQGVAPPLSRSLRQGARNESCRVLRATRAASLLRALARNPGRERPGLHAKQCFVVARTPRPREIFARDFATTSSRDVFARGRASADRLCQDPEPDSCTTNGAIPHK